MWVIVSYDYVFVIVCPCRILYMHMYAYNFLSVNKYVSTYMLTCMCKSVYTCISMRIYMWLFLRVPVCLCVRLHARVFAKEPRDKQIRSHDALLYPVSMTGTNATRYPLDDSMSRLIYILLLGRDTWENYLR